MPEPNGTDRTNGRASVFAHYSMVFGANVHIVRLAAVLQATITVFGLALAWIFLPNERITKLKIGGSVIGIVELR